MSNQISYSKIEHELLPSYRDRLNKAESIEDAKKFFNYTVMELFESIFGQSLNLEYDDIQLRPDKKPYYQLSSKITSNQEFVQTRDNSDLPYILERLANSAVKRYNHLKKHPEKTESKIRM